MTETIRDKDLHGETVYDRGYEYPTDEELRMIFASSCIESVAERLGASPSETYKRMRAVNLIHDYILKHYDVIHSESRENITRDVAEVLLMWEKAGRDDDA